MKKITKQQKWLIIGAGAIAVWYFFLRDEPKEDKKSDLIFDDQIYHPPENPVKHTL